MPVWALACAREISLWFRLLFIPYFFFFSFFSRYYFVVHDSGDGTLQSYQHCYEVFFALCFFVCLKQKKAYIYRFSVSSRERFTYFVYKKRQTKFFFPILHDRTEWTDWGKSQFCRFKILSVLSKLEFGYGICMACPREILCGRSFSCFHIRTQIGSNIVIRCLKHVFQIF